MQIISELVESCRNHDFTDIVVLHEHRGEPDGMVVCHLPFGPTAYFGLYNTVPFLPSHTGTVLTARFTAILLCKLTIFMMSMTLYIGPHQKCKMLKFCRERWQHPPPGSMTAIA